MENIKKVVREKNKALIESGATGYSFKNLYKIIHDQGDRYFCEYMDSYKVVKIKYTEFDSYVKKMATFLNKNIEYKKSEFVGILLENSVNWLAVFWALLMIGYKPLLINAKLPLFLNKDVLNMSNCEYVITDESFDKYDLNVKTLKIEKNTGIIDVINQENEYVDNTWEDSIALTSTATSLNIKICVYTGSDFTNQMLNTKYILSNNKMIKAHYKGCLKQLTFLPFYHIFGLIATYFWFATYGRTFVFLKDYSSNTILKTIRKHEVTHVFAVPLLWHTFYKEIMKTVNGMDEKTKRRFDKGVKLSLTIQNLFPILGQKIASKLFREVQDKTFGNSIKFMISGGGYISQDTIRIINALGYPLYNGYGSTEIGITSVELRSKPSKRIESSVGKPFPSVKYNIEDGVLFIKGKSLCSKIINKDGSFDINHDDWFNTNDLVSADKNGYYFINGRKDDVFISSNGENINPDTLEKELKFSLVNHYAVLGLGKELALVVEIDRDINDIKIRKILTEIKSNLDRINEMHYVFDNIYYSFDPICNANAIKVSRKALLKLIETKQVRLENIKDFNVDKIKDVELISRETCNEVKKIMANILNKDLSEIKDDSHFIFDLGGSSLDYCTLLMELKKRFDIEFDLKEQSFANAIDFSNYIIKKMQ